MIQENADEVPITNDGATILRESVTHPAASAKSKKDIECKPLSTLDELFSWKSSDSDWSTMVQSLSPRSNHCYAGKDVHCHKKTPKLVKLPSASTPKTLICHDMKGGYLDDRFVNGSEYKNQYLFYHWSVIDIFVYFSHHFITIPPLMWINAAHNHRVQILGTVITEGTGGTQIWNEIFSDESIQNRFVDQLVTIQKHYRFDGYLINIENTLTSEQLPKLEKFLRDLKSRIHGLVIWYDAVSFVDGRLQWQDTLNEHNKKAFDICDGIFLNYNWNSNKLQESLSNAGVRFRDVYVGIDVFPRGRQNAGGFYTKDALATVRSLGLSAAIFAFGWTFESNSENFFSVERKFWTQLFPYLYVHCPNSTPFKTDYNIGVAGVPQKETLWYDLSLQSFKLSIQSCLSGDADWSCFNYVMKDGFSKDGCLSLNTKEVEVEIHRLLLCNFCTSEKSPLNFSISARGVTEFHPFEIFLTIENENQRFTLELLFSDKEEDVLKQVDHSCSVALSKEINQARTIQTASRQWITNSFLLKFDGTITDIVARIETPTMIGSLSFE